MNIETTKPLFTYPTELDGFSYTKEWNGESSLIVGLHPESGLPVILPPVDAKKYVRTPEQDRRDAAELAGIVARLEEQSRNAK